MDKPEDIDLITAALHGDKKAVLRAELVLVHNELGQRLRINTAQRDALATELSAVRQRIIDLSPPGDAGTHHTREELAEEKEYAKLAHEWRQEQKDCWNDLQQLRGVERNLLVQLAFLDQRDRQLREFFDAP